ncbi:MAG: STAS domain-containing protein [Chloroflexi bacterium]|nr:STAS domain-containing protein [Chloroflexota bacterium]
MKEQLDLARVSSRVIELETVGNALSEQGDNSITISDMENLKLTDLVELERLQELQDRYSDAVNIAALLFDPDGKPITEPSNFSDFCNIIRATEKGAVACESSDASDAELAGQSSHQQDSPALHPCGNFAEIMDGAVPIIVNDQHIATWGIGQVAIEEIDDDKIRKFAQDIKTDQEELVAASKKLFRVSKERFEKIAYFLDILAKHVSQVGLQSLQQARLLNELERIEKERIRLQQQFVEAQQQVLRELSTPIIPIMDRIIVMPLVGSIDSMRARDITRSLLAGIRQQRAKVVILDITGVPLVDSGVANHLNKTIQAARLKGARTIVTGISDAVAETIVDLGIDWSGVETVRDLRTGLLTALATIGLRIARGGGEIN